MKQLTFSIPWAALASSNQRNRRKGGKAHSWSYRRSLRSIHTVALMHVPTPHPHLRDNVTVWLWFFPPDRRKRDVHNFTKVILDGVEGVCFADDYQVDDLRVVRADVDRENPRVEVEVRGVGA